MQWYTLPCTEHSFYTTDAFKTKPRLVGCLQVVREYEITFHVGNTGSY
jgi:hypothetical protein